MTAAPQAGDPHQDVPPLLTIAEAATRTGLSKKAMRSRVDRGAIPVVKGADDVRRIALPTLVQLGLLTPEGTPPAAPEAAPAAAPPAPVARARADADRVGAEATAAVAAVERLAGELATHRLLESQASEREQQERRARHALEAELQAARASAKQAQLRADAAEARLAEVLHDDDGDAGGGGGTTSPTAVAVTAAVARPTLWHRLTGRSGTALVACPA